jgi:hypothetical protein
MYFEWWKNFFFSAERYFLITNMALKSAGALWNYTRRRILFSRSLGTHIHTRSLARSADGLRRGHITYMCIASMQMGHCLMTQRRQRELSSAGPNYTLRSQQNKILK